MTQRIQKKHKRTNTTWGKPISLTAKYGAQNISKFDKVVIKLQLVPEQYEQSQALRDWVKTHHKHHYVPEHLLLAFKINTQVED